MDPSATGTFVQIVDILGDDGDVRIVLPRGDRAVPLVRFDVGDQIMAPQIPSPHAFRVVPPSLGAGQFIRVEAGPQSVLVIPERRHSALRGDPRAAEYRHAHPTKIAVLGRYWTRGAAGLVTGRREGGQTAVRPAANR